MPREAVIIEALRTPVGRRNGALKDWHPVDLLAHALNGLIARTKLDPALIEDVIGGCVMQVGEQAANVTRNAVLAAGWPESVPATTVDRQCGSSQQALHFAAQGVLSGAYDIAVACGVEAMTRVPMGSSAINGPGRAFGPKVEERYNHVPFNQGVGAEMIAERWGFSRTEIDCFSMESHRRAGVATAEGRFASQIVPVPVAGESGTYMMDRDEGIRADTTVEKLATLKTPFKADGVVSAGNASQISDGASAILVMERSVAEKMGMRPMARIIEFALAGADPVIMLTAPMPATQKLLARAKLTIDQIDLAEVNEAFATVPMAWLHDLKGDHSRMNVNGGAVALGHPLGASGARLMTTLVHELVRSCGRYGLQTMCEGGGMANATLIERIVH